MWYTIKNASNELIDTIHNSYSNALSNAPSHLENKSMCDGISCVLLESK